MGMQEPLIESRFSGVSGTDRLSVGSGANTGEQPYVRPQKL